MQPAFRYSNQSHRANGCTLYLSGEEEHVIRAATEHAVSFHGHKDTPELRAWFHSNLKDEPALAHA